LITFMFAAKAATPVRRGIWRIARGGDTELEDAVLGEAVVEALEVCTLDLFLFSSFSFAIAKSLALSAAADTDSWSNAALDSPLNKLSLLAATLLRRSSAAGESASTDVAVAALTSGPAEDDGGDGSCLGVSVLVPNSAARFSATLLGEVMPAAPPVGEVASAGLSTDGNWVRDGGRLDGRTPLLVPHSPAVGDATPLEVAAAAAAAALARSAAKAGLLEKMVVRFTEGVFVREGGPEEVGLCALAVAAGAAAVLDGSAVPESGAGPDDGLDCSAALSLATAEAAGSAGAAGSLTTAADGGAVIVASLVETIEIATAGAISAS
jgi:hypothetical protein